MYLIDNGSDNSPAKRVCDAQVESKCILEALVRLHDKSQTNVEGTVFDFIRAIQLRRTLI